MPYYIQIVLGFTCFINIHAQTIPNGTLEVSQGQSKFALNLLQQTAELAGPDLNIALSPYTVWNLLTIISEGANQNTLRELQHGLSLPNQDKMTFRQNYRQFANLATEAKGVTFTTTNAIFTTNQHPLNKNFQDVSQNVYNVSVIPVNFRNPDNAVDTINRFVAKATNDRIPNFVNTGDVEDAAIFLTSALFFKGAWNNTFNISQTALKPFYDEAGNKIGEVEMMYKLGPFVFTLVIDLNAHVVQLPYGDGSKYSMIIVVPRKGEKLSNVLRKLATTYPLSELLDLLVRTQNEYGEDNVEVSVPKFNINSELNLNEVLVNMGIAEVFSAAKADLLGIFPHYLYLSRVLQKAVIEVNEEGTVAAAVSGGVVTYKQSTPKLVADKPFAFFIVDNQAGSIIFTGKVSNPVGLCDKCTGN